MGGFDSRLNLRWVHLTPKISSRGKVSMVHIRGTLSLSTTIIVEFNNNFLDVKVEIFLF